MRIIPFNIVAFLPLLIGCSPTVKVEAPDKPIQINMNVNIKHKIRVQVDKELEDVMRENPDIF
jgi:hypothetical protein